MCMQCNLTFLRIYDFIPRNVNVAGCHPPWYLFWFKQWQSLLNNGVQEAFQDLADNYEKITDVPEGFAPHKDVYVHYKEFNLKELFHDINLPHGSWLMPMQSYTG